jgi:hypothetical protein
LTLFDNLYTCYTRQRNKEWFERRGKEESVAGLQAMEMVPGLDPTGAQYTPSPIQALAGTPAYEEVSKATTSPCENIDIDIDFGTSTSTSTVLPLVLYCTATATSTVMLPVLLAVHIYRTTFL